MPARAGAAAYAGCTVAAAPIAAAKPAAHKPLNNLILTQTSSRFLSIGSI
jgi:hypothetical protein